MQKGNNVGSSESEPGVVDNIAIFDHELTAPEVLDLYEKGKPIPNVETTYDDEVVDENIETRPIDGYDNEVLSDSPYAY